MSGVKKNFAFQISYQFLTMLLPFITAPYIARVLGVSNVGIYSYTYSMVNYFVLFAGLGIQSHGSRSIAQVKSDKDKLNLTFSSLYTLHGIISIVSIALYVVYVIYLVRPEYRLFSAVQGIFLAGAVFDINWLFMGLEKFQVIVIRNTIIKLLSVVCVFVFVNSRENLLTYILIMSISYFCTQFIVWGFLKQNVSFVKPNKLIMLESILPLLILFVAIMASSIYRTIDKVMLGQMCTMVEVGSYENADKMIMFPVGIITALGTIMLPHMSKLNNDGDSKSYWRYLHLSMEFAIIVSTALGFGLMSIAEDFSIIFFGEEFVLTGYILKYISVSIIFISFNNVIRTQFIIPKGKDHIYMIAVSIGAVSNVIINVLLIPIFGVYGSVIGTVIAYLIVWIYQSFKVRKEVPIKAFTKFSVVPTLAGVVMFLSVRYVSSFLKKSILSLFIQVGTGGLIYLALILMYLSYTKGSEISKYIKFMVNK